MPRYIDADKFKEHIASFTGLFTEEGFMIDYQAVLTAIDNAYAADVVPKSEVDEMKIILATYGLQDRIRLAREIFAEIERTCVDSFGNFYIGATHGAFAELKKKYTEEAYE